MALDIAKALAYLHGRERRVVHQDVRPLQLSMHPALAWCSPHSGFCPPSGYATVAAPWALNPGHPACLCTTAAMHAAPWRHTSCQIGAGSQQAASHHKHWLRAGQVFQHSFDWCAALESRPACTASFEEQRL